MDALQQYFSGSMKHQKQTSVCPVWSSLNYAMEHYCSDYVEKTLAEQEKFLDRFVSLPFDDKAHLHAARIRADLARAGTPIGPYDLLIAAIALANDLILITHNTREFGRIAELKIEDWEASES